MLWILHAVDVCAQAFAGDGGGAALSCEINDLRQFFSVYKGLVKGMGGLMLLYFHNSISF